MSACEVCWEKAWWAAQFRGTSQVDEYHQLVAIPHEHEEDNDE